MKVQPKQDRQGVRTPAELERKYPLGDIAKLDKEVDGLKKTVNLLQQKLNDIETRLGKSGI
jgi:hypothetical protein